MRTGPAEIILAIAVPAVVLMVLAAGCQHGPALRDTMRLRTSMTEAASAEEIEEMIRAGLHEQYPHEDLTGSYRIYYVTNGPAPLLFAQVGNAPRGLSMFNLYCYEPQGAKTWLLRAYVPVNEYFYTNGEDWHLEFRVGDKYVNVMFRGRIVFTIARNASSAQ